VPEAWEYADEDQWNQIQQGILDKFAKGPAPIVDVLARILEVKRQKPKETKPKVPRYTPTEQAAAQTEYERYITSGAEQFGNVRPAGLPGLEKVLGTELSRPEYIATLPVGGLSGIIPGTAGLLGMRGAELATEKYNLPPAAAIPLTLGAGLGAGLLGAGAQTAALRGAAALPGVAERAMPVLRRTVAEEVGGLKPKIPEPAAGRSVADIETDLALLRNVKPRPELADAVQNKITQLETELAQAKGVTQVTAEAAQAVPEGLTPGVRVSGLTPDGKQFRGDITSVTGDTVTVQTEAGLDFLQPEVVTTSRANVRPTMPRAAEAPAAPKPAAPVTEAYRPTQRELDEAILGGAKPPTEPPVTEMPTGAAPLEEPVAKLTRLIKSAKPVRREAEVLKHEELQRRAGALAGVFEAEPGRAGIPKALGQLKGEVPKPSFEPAEAAFTLDEIDGLFVSIRDKGLQPFQELNTKLALEKVLAGELPTTGEISLLQKTFGKEFGEALFSKQGIGQRAWAELWDALNIPRGVLSAYDISAPLRQGAPLAMRHPREWFSSITPMLKAFAREKWAAAIEKDLETGPAFERAQRAGLYQGKWGPTATLAEREERYLVTERTIGSKLLRGLPGVRMSERAYVTFLNWLRRGVFDNQVANWDKVGLSDLVAESELAGAVNAASGRGRLGALTPMAQPLSGGFFAPRLVMGRIQYPMSLFAKSPQVRRLVAEELLAFVGTGTALLALLKVSGAANVELNPLSSDFGKARIGNTRIDIWGGYQPLVRYTAQLLTGARKTIGTGEIVPADRKQVFTRFLQSKLSPQAGTAVDLWRGETYMGEDITSEPTSVRTQLFNRLTPLFLQDMTEAIRDNGVRGGFTAAPGVIGVGVQTFYTAGQKVDTLTKKYDPQGRSYNQMATVEFDRLMADHPDLAAARQDQLSGAASWGAVWANQKIQQQQEDQEFQTQFLDALNSGTTMADLSDELSAYLRERAVRSQERFGKTEDDPRNDLERKLDAYYALELPRFATDKERQDFYQQQETMLNNDPELAAAIRDAQGFHFTDPKMQQVVKQIWDARQVRREYYSIPPFLDLSLEDGNQLNNILAEAQAMVTLGKAGSRKQALLQMYEDGRCPESLLTYAVYAERLRNPERQEFRLAHADEMAMFEPLPYEEAQ
jgi:hypothetical protein